MNKLYVLVLLAILLASEATGMYSYALRRQICPEKKKLIMRVKACSKVLRDTSNREDKITHCYSLKGAQDCLAEVYSGCTAYDLILLKLPNDIRYAEREVNRQISKCEIF